MDSGEVLLASPHISLLDFLLAFVYLLTTLLLFRVFASAETLDLSAGNSFLFLLSCAALLTFQTSGGGAWSSLLVGAGIGAALSLLLFSFCAGAHGVTYAWLVLGLIQASVVVGAARAARFARP